MAWVLTALIRMYQHRLLRSTPPHGRQKRIQDNIFGHAGLHWPADNFAREQPNNYGQIKVAFVDSDVGFAHYPTFILCFRAELYRFNIKLLGITLTTHVHLSLSQLNDTEVSVKPVAIHYY